MSNSPLEATTPTITKFPSLRHAPALLQFAEFDAAGRRDYMMQSDAATLASLFIVAGAMSQFLSEFVYPEIDHAVRLRWLDNGDDRFTAAIRADPDESAEAAQHAATVAPDLASLLPATEHVAKYTTVMAEYEAAKDEGLAAIDKLNAEALAVKVSLEPSRQKFERACQIALSFVPEHALQAALKELE